MTKPTKPKAPEPEKREVGRPSKFKPEFVQQGAKLAALGATDREVAEFFDTNPGETEWLAACLTLIRLDRSGVIAAQKRSRAERKRRHLASSPSARLRNATAARIWASLKGRSDGALFSRLGYTVDHLRARLESLFIAGMCWANYGAWHVDHIKPCAAFDLTDPVQFARCWSLENLQPLWAADNCRKGASLGAA